MGFLTNLLKEIPTAGVARERVAIAEAKFAAVEKENEHLRGENAHLRGEVEALRRLVPKAEFVESHGVLFKRKGDGSLDKIVYCPDCKRAMNSLQNMLPFRCSKCKFLAPFTGEELERVLAEVQSS